MDNDSFEKFKNVWYVWLDFSTSDAVKSISCLSQWSQVKWVPVRTGCEIMFSDKTCQYPMNQFKPDV